ncbi:MAG: formylglycine-generating enzyme family protein, partial [Syntrophales bacterium]|nr:formylglycine-generating enzyme family protein [Syntrophales bacterium]
MVAKQVGNRAEFTYDLIGEEADAEVNVTITVQGKTYRASELHLEGDFGKVTTGRQKKIYWNVLQDFPRGVSGTLAWEIVAGGKEFVSRVLGAKFVLIPAGTFMMGSPADEPERFIDEIQHRVTISKPFYLQTTEVTQGQWRAVMGNNPSYFRNCGDYCPVERVSWNDVQEFIRRLNRMEGTDKYRLP